MFQYGDDGDGDGEINYDFPYDGDGGDHTKQCVTDLAEVTPFEDCDIADQTPSSPPPRARSLIELKQGKNSDAARQEIEDKVYVMAVVMNFIGMKLVNSSGAKHPSMYDTENRQFLIERPHLTVRSGGLHQSPLVTDPSRGTKDDMSLETCKK